MAVKQMESERAQARDQKRESGESRQTEQGRQEQGTDTQRNQARPQGQLSQERGMTRTLAPVFLSPFTLLQRFFMGDVAEFLDELNARRGGQSQPGETGADQLVWAPKVDVMQRGNELVVRADLPGIKPEDVVVEISDDAITISGERGREHEEDRGQFYRFERSYGAFVRVIPLPEGAIVDQAKASFKDGVLEVTVPAPPEQVSRGRRLDVTRDDDADKSTARDQSTSDQNRR